MRTGTIEANLLNLNVYAKLPDIEDFVAAKLAGPEKGVLDAADLAFHESEYLRLTRELQGEHSVSSLPDVPSAKAALNDLLVRLRLADTS